jgi:hypothetical protein
MMDEADEFDLLYEWQERVAICVAEGVSEERAEEIAWEQIEKEIS